jgi:hypothetical protein
MAWVLAILFGLLELVTMPLLWILRGFVTLDDRYGWTKRGRAACARRALEKESAVSLASAEGLPRAVVEGTLVARTHQVIVPILKCEAIAWGVTVHKEEPKPCVSTVRGVGENAPVDLLDETGRAQLPSIATKDIVGCGQGMPIDDVPADWAARAGPSAHNWTLWWTVEGTTVRASGKVTRSEGAGYRDPPAVLAFSASDDGVPVLVVRRRPSR